MKGVSPLIATVLIIAISIVAIGMALQMGRSGIDRNKEILLLQEAERNLGTIDDTIKRVVIEGNGSARVLDATVTGGEFSIDSSAESISYSMQSKAQIVGIGVSNIENGVNVTGYLEEIRLRLDYNYDILDSLKFGAGKWRITIKNEGYDAVAGKQLVMIKVG